MDSITAPPLDITKYPTLTLDDLKQRIVKDVEATQTTKIYQLLPDVLIMRRDQFDLACEDPDMAGMYNSKDNMWRTPLNVLEVRVAK